MRRGEGGGWVRRMRTVGTAVMLLALLAACSNDEETATEPQLPPGAVTVQAESAADTVNVSWTQGSLATSYRVELSGGGTIAKTAGADETSTSFTGDDGIQDGVQYTATVYAINEDGETASENTPQVTTNFFRWDETYATSLHRTGMGKQTFYDANPNGGFEVYTQVPYDALACKGCHEPGAGGKVKGERGCMSCHETDDPQLGAEVDATLQGVCGPCHGRQKAEALKHQFPDVHRDAGMDCMACHTLEDVHGDGNEYASMLEDGAIDANCQDCHTSVASNVYHNAHAEDIDCSACHTESVVTCNNCHFETEIEADQKVAYGQFKNWIFLLNRNGKVHVGNYQSVTYQGRSIVAFAPFYAHTITRRAIEGCDDCHGNPAVEDWHEDGVIDLVVWDETKNDPNGKNLTYQQGVIPVPPNFFQGGLRFDFVNLDQPAGTQWSFLKTGADIYQMLYASPLTEAQMEALR